MFRPPHLPLHLKVLFLKLLLVKALFVLSRMYLQFKERFGRLLISQKYAITTPTKRLDGPGVSLTKRDRNGTCENGGHPLSELEKGRNCDSAIFASVDARSLNIQGMK